MNPMTRRRRVFQLAAWGLVVVCALAVGVPPVSAQTNLVAFPWDWSRAHESALDLSRFLDAPAGGDGFVRVDNGQFVTAQGKRLRFWGVNIAGGGCFPPKDQAALVATDLARLGFNFVRFHAMDSDWGARIFPKDAPNTRAFDQENLDRFDFFVAELKQRGIWFSLTMNVFRKFRDGDGVRDHKLLGIGKGATYFSPRLVELQHEFTRHLLTHKNPYTGHEYRHEPALATIEMVNENSLLEAWINWRLVGRDDKAGQTWSPLPVSYANELTEQYNAWLAKNRTREQLAELRKETNTDLDALIPRLHPDKFHSASRLRFHGETEFLMHLESTWFAGMKRLIRDELGAKQLLVGTADHNDWYAGYAHIASMLQFDVIHANGYWQHPDIGAVTKIKNDPMVNDPLDCPFNQFARTPVAGKPFVIAETNHPFPHKYAAEGYATLAAYALLHDWDGITWFDWGGGRLSDPKLGIRPHGWFDVSQDPVKLAHLIAAGLMWHRRDVAEAKETVRRAYTHDEMVEAIRMDTRKTRPYFTPGYALSTALQRKTRWALTDKPTTATYPTAAPFADIASDTGELRWRHADQKRGVLTVATPRTEALIGFVRGSGESVPHLSADVTNDFVSITLTTLDDAPFARSRLLLLVATTGAAVNTGQKFAEDGKTLAEWGKGPVLIEPVAGTVTLRDLGKVKSIRVRPLTPEGRYLDKDLSAEKTAKGWLVKLGEAATTWVVVEVTR